MLLRALRLAVAAVFLCAVTAPAVAAQTNDLVLDQASGHVIDALINGKPVRLRVDPETSGYIILNGEAAKRIGLRPSLLRGETVIGPVRLGGPTKVARVTIGETSGRRRLVWTDREAVSGADGLVGPADLPFDTVTFHLRTPVPTERALELPMAWDRSFGLFHPVKIGDQTIRFRISTIRKDAVATAAAAAVIAEPYGGTWVGPFSEQMIKYEIVRPVRPMALQRPLLLNGLAVDRFMVRTSDSRGNNVLPPDQQADPDEIVVTGERQRQRARYDVSLGLDTLSRCSSLTWDKRSRRMTMRCA